MEHQRPLMTLRGRIRAIPPSRILISEEMLATMS
jgi:hypothetical protein